MLSIWERQSFASYDVVIVGAGISGLSTAASLKEHDPSLDILVIESGLLPSGASTKNAGFACFGSLTELLSDLEKMGEEKTRNLVSKRWNGLTKLKSRLGDENIDFQKKGGYELLEKQNLHLLGRVVEVNELLTPIFNEPVFEDRSSLVRDFGFKGYNGMIFNHLEGQLDTGKMMKSLLSYCQYQGIQIMTGASVINYQSGDNVDLEIASGLKIRAKQLALCTNAFTTKLTTADLQPGRGLVLALKPERVPFQGTFHIEEGYYYFRDYYDKVIFGGGRNLAFKEEESTQFEINPMIEEKLLQMLKESILPGISFEVTDKWTGIMAFGETKEPIIKMVEPGVFLGVRLGGMGVAIGSLVGEQLAALIRQSL